MAQPVRAHEGGGRAERARETGLLRTAPQAPQQPIPQAWRLRSFLIPQPIKGLHLLSCFHSQRLSFTQPAQPAQTAWYCTLTRNKLNIAPFLLLPVQLFTSNTSYHRYLATTTLLAILQPTALCCTTRSPDPTLPLSDSWFVFPPPRPAPPCRQATATAITRPFDRHSTLSLPPLLSCPKHTTMRAALVAAAVLAVSAHAQRQHTIQDEVSGVSGPMLPAAVKAQLPAD